MSKAKTRKILGTVGSIGACMAGWILIDVAFGHAQPITSWRWWVILLAFVVSNTSRDFQRWGSRP